MAVDLVGGSRAGADDKQFKPWVSLTGQRTKALEQMILNRPHCTRAHLIHKLCWLKQVQISGLIL